MKKCYTSILYIFFYFIDILFLSPSGIVPIFVNSSVIFTCFHTSQTFQNFVWLINGTRVESSLITNHHIDNTSTDYSDLTIFSLPLQFNGTDIQCHVRFPNGNLLLSETSRLLLQGKMYIYIHNI